MPGSEQFSRAVRGSAGTPISVTQNRGSIETDNYTEGGGFNYDGTAYPYTIDPAAETIQEVNITKAGDVDMVITTVTGTVIRVPLKNGTGSFDKWSIDSITFEDPQAGNSPLGGAWAGE